MLLNVPSVSYLLEDVRNPYTFLITDIDRFICRWKMYIMYHLYTLMNSWVHVYVINDTIIIS